MVSRRTALLAPLAQAVIPSSSSAANGKMSLSIHQNTSRAAGYRKSLEGWARAGIKNVEITDVMLEDFLKTDDLTAARRVVTDLGLTPVSCAAVLQLNILVVPTEQRCPLRCRFAHRWCRCSRNAAIVRSRCHRTSSLTRDSIAGICSAVTRCQPGPGVWPASRPSATCCSAS